MPPEILCAASYLCFFPLGFMPLAVARESSVKLIDEAVASGQTIAVFAQKEAGEDEPSQNDLHQVGTASQIHKMFKLPDGSLRIIVQGLARVRLEEITAQRPYLRGRVTEAPEVLKEDDRLEIDALQRNIKANFQQIVSLSPLMSDDLQALAFEHHRCGRLAISLHRARHHRNRNKKEGLQTLDVARASICSTAADQGRKCSSSARDPSQCSRSRQEPARLLPARAAEGDSEGARRGRRSDARD